MPQCKQARIIQLDNSIKTQYNNTTMYNNLSFSVNSSTQDTIPSAEVDSHSSMNTDPIPLLALPVRNSAKELFFLILSKCLLKITPTGLQGIQVVHPPNEWLPPNFFFFRDVWNQYHFWRGNPTSSPVWHLTLCILSVIQKNTMCFLPLQHKTRFFRRICFFSNKNCHQSPQF